MVLAPERFSTMIGCPNAFSRYGCSRRAMMSCAAPAFVGTTMRMGRPGEMCGRCTGGPDERKKREAGKTRLQLRKTENRTRTAIHLHCDHSLDFQRAAIAAAFRSAATLVVRRLQPERATLDHQPEGLLSATISRRGATRK